MKAFDEHFDSARRHFGVALIDLNYAAADLAQSVVCPEMELGANAALELLNREIERLVELSAFIETVSEMTPGERSGSALLQRWWPDLVRHQEAHSSQD